MISVLCGVFGGCCVVTMAWMWAQSSYRNGYTQGCLDGYRMAIDEKPWSVLGYSEPVSKDQWLRMAEKIEQQKTVKPS
jgi:hypothetical protein